MRNIRIAYSLSTICGCVIFAVGCGPGVSSQQANAPNPTILEEIVEETDTSYSLHIELDEAQRFGTQLAASVTNDDVTSFLRLIDFGAIAERSIEGLELSKKSRSGFLAGVNIGYEKFFLQLRQTVSDGGGFDSVRVNQRGSHYHVMMRLVDFEGALNYLDIRLVKDGESIRGDQIFLASTGESWGDSIRKLVGTGLQSQSSMVGRLSGQAKRELKRIESIGLIRQAINAGNADEALSIIATLSEEDQQLKLVRMMRIEALSFEDEESLLREIDAVLDDYPNDIAASLMGLDAAILRQDDELLMKCFDAIQQWTGGDPFLQLLVAAFRAENGMPQQAAKMIVGIDTDGFELELAHQYRFMVSNSLNDHKETARNLRILRDKYGNEFEDLSDYPDFAGFAASEEYQQLLEEQ